MSREIFRITDVWALTSEILINRAHVKLWIEMFIIAQLSNYYCIAFWPLMTKVNGLRVFADSNFYTYSVYWKQIFNSENYFLCPEIPLVLNVWTSFIIRPKNSCKFLLWDYIISLFDKNVLVLGYSSLLFMI